MLVLTIGNLALWTELDGLYGQVEGNSRRDLSCAQRKASVLLRESVLSVLDGLRGLMQRSTGILGTRMWWKN